MSHVLKAMLVTLVVVGLQVQVLPHLRISDVMVELPIAAAVAAGSVAGGDRGAWVGFWAGLLYDVWLPTPFALAALTGALVGWMVGLISEITAFDDGRSSMFVLILELTSGIVGFVVLGEILGQHAFFTGRFAFVLAVSVMMTAPFLPLLRRAYGWAFADDTARARGSRRYGVLS